jgi:hypothetical protein
MLTGKARHAGKGKPFSEFKSGEELYQKTGRWHRVFRLIDRARDWYREFVTDAETGDVIKDVSEPLSHHLGHGSANKGRGQ